jgi:hypothetical protein
MNFINLQTQPGLRRFTRIARGNQLAENRSQEINRHKHIAGYGTKFGNRLPGKNGSNA